MSSSRGSVLVVILAMCAIVVLPSACARHPRPVAAPAPPPSAVQPAAPPDSPAPAPLLGHLTRDEIKAYAPWQPLFVEPYVPDAGAIDTIKANADGVTVLLVMATWCRDSKRELPRFFAIMDRAGIPESQLTMVGVDRSKKDAEGLTEKWGITRVPTFVFLRNGQEAGRIVEKTPPGTTLESEIARVLAARR